MHEVLESLSSETRWTLTNLSAVQTQATPAAHPEKWSIQQIVEHLLKTYLATLPAITTRLEKGSPTRATPTVAQRVGQLGLISLGRFPSGRAAPAAVSPGSQVTPRSGEELIEGILGELLKIDALTNRGEELFGRRRAVSHMILGPLSMQQWRRFHLVHGRHHLKQVAAIRKERGF